MAGPAKVESGGQNGFIDSPRVTFERPTYIYLRDDGTGGDGKTIFLKVGRLAADRKKIQHFVFAEKGISTKKTEYGKVLDPFHPDYKTGFF